ncbi:MAG TPA: LysR family transcriptional regulator [Steroidobacteraceae bacterium]
MDRWYAMKVFVRVVEAGSFVSAAERLKLSTTATSRLVADLESHLGTRLLQRTTRRLRLTEPGQRFFDRARDLLAGLEEAEGEAGVGTQAPTGLLRITTPAIFGSSHLAQLFPLYLRRYPQVTLEVLAIDRIVDLVNDGFDMAIRLSADIHPTHVARKLAAIRWAVCASPAYLERHGTPQTPQDLTQHNCLVHTFGRHAEGWSFKGPDGPVQIPTRGSLHTNNAEVRRSAALAGEGIALEPTFVVGEALSKGDLVPLLRDWHVPETSAMAVYPSRRFVSARVRTFTEFLQQEFSGELPWDRWMK